MDCTKETETTTRKKSLHGKVTRGREEYLSMNRAFYAIRAETGKHSERKGAMFVGDLMRSLEGKPGMSHEELMDMIGLLRTFHSEDHSSCLSIYDDHGWGFIFRGMYSPRPK
ncbi:hypothetical protein PRIPAC_70417 [Pristionchus pacificus]|uniref:Uncharacterized protein n=1 Tax=Pristionchus pacificus TaxID=54126 RepID=A0A2A6BFI3_PRIPA|nr:hypothetical protein PRIPAC_70417 [Pristionchus pacificus]|eukprot:PDM64639.1 hypothetical protein PRIPAC_52895 [Pristionchus pacificus]